MKISVEKIAKHERAALRAENKKWPKYLVVVPEQDWKKVGWDTQERIAVYRSRDWLVQVVKEANGCVRMTVNRTDQDKDGNWIGGITWDELQALKAQVGFADSMAIEIYPPLKDVVNVANMRHLWIPDDSGVIAVNSCIPWWRKR